jgi:hypothetical protein
MRKLEQKDSSLYHQLLPIVTQELIVVDNDTNSSNNNNKIPFTWMCAPFDETMRALTTHFEAMPQWRCFPGNHCWPYWFAHDAPLTFANHRIYCTLLHRVQWASHWLVPFEGILPVTVKRRLRAYLQSHFALAEWFGTHRRFDDALVPPTLRTLPALEREYYPSEDAPHITIERTAHHVLHFLDLLQLAYSDDVSKQFYCPFDDYMQQRMLDMSAIDLAHSKPRWQYFCPHIDWAPIDGLTNDTLGDFSVYLSLLERVNRAVRHMKFMQATQQEQNAHEQHKHHFWVYQFVHSHAQLAWRMVEEARFDDRYWISDDNLDEGAPHRLERVVPCVARVVTAASMPNMTQVVPMLNYLFKRKDNRKQQVPIVHILSKCLPYACQIRAIVTLTYEYMQESRGFSTFIEQVVHCSLLGMYEHCQVRPSFWRQVQILRSLYGNEHKENMCDMFSFFLGCEQVLSSDSIEQLMTIHFANIQEVVKNKRKKGDSLPPPQTPTAGGDSKKDKQQSKHCLLLFFMLGESLMYMLGYNTQLQHTLEQGGYSLTRMAYRIQQMMDRVRHINNGNSGEATGELPNETMSLLLAERELKQQSSSVGKANYILADTTFDMSMMKAISDRTDELLKESLVVHPFVDNPMYDHAQHLVVCPDDVKDHLQAYAERMHPQEAFYFYHLRSPYLGAVSQHDIRLLVEAQQIYYQNSEKSKGRIKAVIRKMSPRGFAIVAHFFNVMLIYRAIQLVELPVEMAERIDEALLIKRYQVYPGEQLPEDYGCVYIAPCCGKMVTSTDARQYGNRDMSYHPEKRTYVCFHESDQTKIRKKRTQAKKSVRSAYRDEADKQHNKQTKRIRREYFRLKCMETPMIRVPLVCHRLVYGLHPYRQVQYQRCPECGMVHEYRDENWGNGGYMCQQCALQHPCRLSIITCVLCNQRQQVREQHWTRQCVIDDRMSGEYANEPRYSWFCPRHSRRFGQHERWKARIKHNDTEVMYLMTEVMQLNDVHALP